MSGPTFTKGPWACTTRRGSWDWVVYCEASPNDEICQPFHDGTDLNEIGEANARLIAAAPDMFAALKMLVADCEGYAAWQRPVPVSTEDEHVVDAVVQWVNTRGGEETADQIAAKAIQAYKRAALTTEGR